MIWSSYKVEVLLERYEKKMTSELVASVVEICWVAAEMDVSINRQALHPVSQQTYAQFMKFLRITRSTFSGPIIIS